ncbi:MAG: hypothetical protein KKE35_03130 [Actinobacteria bacterium]|nr:hypothetical protein [Actinomycetota bacterium]
MSIDQYKDQIISTIEAIEKLKAYEFNINYIFFDDKPIFRYYITDSYLYLAQYLNNLEGHEASVYEFKNVGESMYSSFMKLFLERFERFSK